MAIVKYGSIVTELRGKVGSFVFQKMGTTLSMRVQRSQNCAKTKSGIASRFSFAYLANAWASLTPTQKASYNTQASTYPFSDRFGNYIVVSAYNLFMAIHRRNILYADLIINTASAYYALPAIALIIGTFSNISNSFIFTFTSPIPAGMHVSIYVTLPMPATRSNVNSKYVFIQAFAPGTEGSQNIFTSILTVTGRKYTTQQCLIVKVVKQMTTTGVFNEGGFVYRQPID